MDNFVTMPYAEYLQTEEWLHKREQALTRDEYRCRMCNTSENLQVHHRTYRRRGKEEPTDLTTLCDSCHEHFHTRVKQQEIMDKTYAPPVVEKPITCEDYLMGLLIQNMGLISLVQDIIDLDDFAEEDTRTLYRLLHTAYQEEHSVEVPQDLEETVTRCQNAVKGQATEDQQKKTVVQTAIKVKRSHLLRMNTDFAAKVLASEGVERRRLQVQQQEVINKMKQLNAISV